jgi:hypothetical protein
MLVVLRRVAELPRCWTQCTRAAATCAGTHAPLLLLLLQACCESQCCG